MIIFLYEIMLVIPSFVFFYLKKTLDLDNFSSNFVNAQSVGTLYSNYIRCFRQVGT